MLDSLVIAATGMGAQQLRINTISNNIANVSTNGFKRSRVTFEDLFYRRLNGPSASQPGTESSPQVGLGTAVARTEQLFTQGDLVKTGNPLDMAIKGSGFLEVTLPNGESAYARPGTLSLNDKGELATQDGAVLAAKIQIPPDATQILISELGEVSVRVPDDQNPVVLGQIELAHFTNPEGLQALGAGLFGATEGSGEPSFSIPGQNGVGVLSQGYLEASNVDPVEQFVDLVMAQRAYQFNSKVIQVSDEILSTINNLRR